MQIKLKLVSFFSSEELISKQVFERMVDIVGTSQVVANRREIMNMKEVLNRPTRTATSGSMGEGFRFEESDMDVMEYTDDFQVIWDHSQNQHKSFSEGEIFVFDGSHSPPGYGLLQILSPEELNPLIKVFVKHGNSYLSSTFWKRMFLNPILGSRIHGPCISSNLENLDFDCAECIISRCWPPMASTFLSRCQLWPNRQILQDIVNKECHLVAIGHKLGNHEEEEWMISFSLAEKALVYSMNHSQFLLYGLMKLFLKEIINKGLDEEEEILCSYHIKTAIFWTLQQGSLLECCQRNFLKCFWVCFKLVTKCVYEGVCPNFFIPENNMFLTKCHGSAQRKLFCRLNAIYEVGPTCILNWLSMQDHSPNLYSHTRGKTNDHYIKELYNELAVFALPRYLNFQTCLGTLKSIEQLAHSNCDGISALVVRMTYVSMLQHVAFQLLSLRKEDNNCAYNFDYLPCLAIMQTATLGGVSDLIFSAMYYYRVKKYREALFILKMAKVRLKQPYMIHLGHLDKEYSSEIAACPGNSLLEVVIKSFVFSIKLENTIFYIDELLTEQEHSRKNPWSTIFIPPFVFLLMLEFLCYRHVDELKAQNALDELTFLMYSNQDSYLTYVFQDISWQILGICQEMAGNLKEALYAYRNSLEESIVNRIRSATLQRIQSVKRRMCRI